MLTIITQRSSFQFISNNNKGSHVPPPIQDPESERERGREGTRAWTELKWPSRCLVTAWDDGELVRSSGQRPPHLSRAQTEQEESGDELTNNLRLIFVQRIIYFMLQFDG